ncbi:MAG: YidC/Oxa1 family membrane protein insertase [Bacilli bacterium]
MKKRILLITLILFILTGCTTYLKDEENNVIKYEETGQNLPENIICKPTNKEILKIYNENKVDLKNLEECDEFKLTSGGYEGLWNSFFVKPLAWAILKVGTFVKNYGLSLIIVAFLIRLLLYPLTKGTTQQAQKMKSAKPEIDLIEKKYKGKTAQEEMMKKSQETMVVYKKYGINPLSSCLFAFLQLPLLFAFLEAINRVPAIFEESFLGLQLGTTPLTAILDKGQYYYILVIAVLAVVTVFSVKSNQTTVGDDTNKQMNFMNKFLYIFIPVISLSMSTALSLYWIASSSFTIFQSLIVKRSGKNEIKRI